MGKKPTPKQKHARSKGRSRYARFQYEARKRLEGMTHLHPCPNCKKPKLLHHLCQACGYYGGRMVIDTSKDVKEKITKISA